MLILQNVNKTYSKSTEHALKNVNLHVKKGKIFGVIGLSGAGKSTLLRSIAGLVSIDEGKIIIDNTDISTLSKNEYRLFKQNIGVVFQGYNLLQQKTVFDNIALPMKFAKCSKEKIEEVVSELINLVGLSGKENSYPSQLSGGQQQRVAIARALTLNPKLLLLDELTSALDPLTTKQILKLLKDINEKYGVTMLLITHEISVVSSICDEVAVLNYGIVEEFGLTSEVLNEPKTDITKMLLGRGYLNG